MTNDATDRMEPSKGLLVAEHLAYRRGLRDIVADVSLRVGRGEAVALLGRNGAGKSTGFSHADRGGGTRSRSGLSR